MGAVDRARYARNRKAAALGVSILRPRPIGVASPCRVHYIRRGSKERVGGRQCGPETLSITACANSEAVLPFSGRYA
jgi:hypothetical protein